MWEMVGALREGERDLLSSPSSLERAKAGHLPADAGRAPIVSGEGGREVTGRAARGGRGRCVRVGKPCQEG